MRKSILGTFMVLGLSIAVPPTSSAATLTVMSGDRVPAQADAELIVMTVVRPPAPSNRLSEGYRAVIESSSSCIQSCFDNREWCDSYALELVRSRLKTKDPELVNKAIISGKKECQWKYVKCTSACGG